jgi:hypothetical protein
VNCYISFTIICSTQIKKKLTHKQLTRQIFVPNVQFKISELISNQTWTTEELSTSTPKNFETTVAKENTDKVAKMSISNKKLILILCWVKIFSSTVLVKTSLRIVFVLSVNISLCLKYLEKTYRLLKIIENHMIFHVTGKLKL